MKCQLCEREGNVIYDSVLVGQNAWAYLCEACFKTHGSIAKYNDMTVAVQLCSVMIGGVPLRGEAKLQHITKLREEKE